MSAHQRTSARSPRRLQHGREHASESRYSGFAPTWQIRMEPLPRLLMRGLLSISVQVANHGRRHRQARSQTWKLTRTLSATPTSPTRRGSLAGGFCRRISRAAGCSRSHRRHIARHRRSAKSMKGSSRSRLPAARWNRQNADQVTWFHTAHLHNHFVLNTSRKRCHHGVHLVGRPQRHFYQSNNNKMAIPPFWATLLATL